MLRRGRCRRLLCVLAATLALAGAARAGMPDDLSQLLRANHQTLVVKDGVFSGPGAALVRQAVRQAQFVAVGEQHGTREIPRFVAALCRAMAPDGLDAMAVEAGPFAIDALAPWTVQRDGSAAVRAEEDAYPGYVAFFDWQAEFDLLGACERAADPPPALWGLDQEFVGSAPFLLQAILDAKPDAAVAAATRTLLEKCRAFDQASRASGDWRQDCLFRLTDAGIGPLQAAIARQRNPRAAALLAALMKTRHIYTRHESGDRYGANRERALLLKANFGKDYRDLAATLHRPPRILLKFGENHLYRGFDTTNLADLGNFVTEFADGLASTSLHIIVLGVRGTDAESGGPGQASRAVPMQPLDAAASDYAYLAPFLPMVPKADDAAMMVFDLRPLRSHLASWPLAGRDLERLVLGYDLLVLMPSVTASSDVR